MKQQAIATLTKLVPREQLRKLYIGYFKTLSYIKYGDTKFPRIISIEINTHCNRACSYCPNIIYPQQAQLIDDTLMYRLLDRIAEIKYHGVVDFIFFSEPTLNPKLPKYVEYLRHVCPSAIPRICTNGDFLTSELVYTLKEAGLNRIYPMRHVPTPEGWIENLTRLSKEFPGLIQLMDIEEVEATSGLNDFNGLLEVKKHRSRFFKRGKAHCYVHEHVCQITIDGKWDLCCVDYAKTLQFGDVVKDGFLKIWNDLEFKKVRANLESGIPAAKVCKTCTCLVERGDYKDPKFISREDASKLPQNQKPLTQYPKIHKFHEQNKNS